MKPQPRKPRRDFGFAHTPKRVCGHVAQEVRELPPNVADPTKAMTGPAAAEEFVRGLLPQAANNALGLAPETPAMHKGWSPSVKPDRLAAAA